jgi:hypothetical protein
VRVHEDGHDGVEEVHVGNVYLELPGLRVVALRDVDHVVAKSDVAARGTRARRKELKGAAKGVQHRLAVDFQKVLLGLGEALKGCVSPLARHREPRSARQLEVGWSYS